MIVIQHCERIILWLILRFNLSDWGVDKLKEDVRWQYGTPPAGNANFAWLQHMIYHLAPAGRIGMVLANGSLSSQSGGEGEIVRILSMQISLSALLQCLLSFLYNADSGFALVYQ